MKKLFLVISMSMLLLSLFAFITETASFENFLIRDEPNCAYSNWVSHIAEGIARPGYNGYAPHDRQTNGFGDFKNPSTSQLNNWGIVIDYFIAGELENAQTVINNSGFPYEVVLFNDTDTDQVYYVLRELVDMSYYDDNGTPDDPSDDEIGAFDWGWGLYVFKPEGPAPIIVSAPHPNDDYITPIIGYDAFVATNAAFYMVSGTGREVRWSNVGSYTNAKSISDPTRNNSHPFNVAYTRFADYIRDTFDTREFSLQVHAYDYDLHIGYANTQISAGNNKTCPTLPIRDLSSNKRDIISQGEHLMIPANTIGTHADVYLNDYYSVYYDTHDFIFSDGEVSYPINDHINLPGYQNSRQMLYTLSGINDYDVVSPFFHIEMDELPNCYVQDELNYHWFHGWDENIGKWDMPNRYERPRKYYRRWVDDLASVLDDMFAMDDEVPPTTPENLELAYSNMYSVMLAWEKSDSYDFDSYEILYGTEPVTEDNSIIIDRGDILVLASQALERVEVPGLARDTQYYFKIRARDKNGNYSELSNEVTNIPMPVNISTFTAHGMTNSNRVFWGAQSLSGFAGFGLLRKHGDGEYELIDSYEENTMLVAGQYSYEYWDMDLENNVEYTYQLAIYKTDGTQLIHTNSQSAVPTIIHSLQISGSGRTNTAEFGQNPYATDEKDAYWDVNKSSPTTNYVWVAFWEEYWGNSGTHLDREVMGGYDVDEDLKTWVVRARSSFTNTPLFISLPTARRGEKVYIYDNATGDWQDLVQGPYQFSVSSSTARTMTLYWGNLQPKVKFSYMNNQIVQGGSNLFIGWNYDREFLIESMDLYVANETDSLLLAEGLTIEDVNHSWAIPQNIDIPKAKIVMKATSVDGQINYFESDYTIAIVPYMNSFTHEPGWASLTKAFTINQWNTENIFGAGASSFMYDEEWLETDDLLFAKGYVVNITEPVMQNVVGGIQKNLLNVPLNHGWNLLGNPHLCEYELSNIQFIINGINYKYGEMIAQQLISPSVYVYRDGAFIHTEKILPYESFFIKNVSDPNNEITLRFYPYFESLPVSNPTSDWELKVFANDDSFVFGASCWASDGYDFRYDLPKVPDHEIFPNVRIYIDKSDIDGFAEPELYSEYRNNLLFTGEEMQMDFPFKLIVKEAGEVEFRFEKFNIPDSWTPQMHLLGNQVTARTGIPFTLYIDEPGEYDGIFSVHNHYVSNADLVAPPRIELTAYPNPFNPNVNIAFTLPQMEDCSVSIYNLRGQKVNTLHSGTLGAGLHTLTWNGVDRNGRSVASGVYFARVKTPKQNKSIKIMLMK